MNNTTTQVAAKLHRKPFDFGYSITPHLTKMRASIKATKYAVSEVAVIGKHSLCSGPLILDTFQATFSNSAIF